MKSRRIAGIRAVRDRSGRMHGGLSVIEVVDFFCGCGGTSAGLRDAGMKILAGIDNDADAGRTFTENFPDAKFFLKDIRRLRHRDLASVISENRENREHPLLFSACAPCQPFTRQRTTRGREDDRATLLDEIHSFIEAFRPCYVFVENVAGLQKVDRKKGPVSRFTQLLARLGYEHDTGILKAQDFGVPQYRRRFVLLASLLGPIEVPDATHGPGTNHPELETVWKWIRDLPSLEAGQSSGKVGNHCAANLSRINLERIRATPPGCGRESWPERLKLDCHRNYKGHTDVYGRLRKDRPAAALTTRCISLSNGRYGHPEQNRALSVREAARLQTFDDSFEFFGSMGSMARQIGNAVPVKLASAVGKHVLRHEEACGTCAG